MGIQNSVEKCIREEIKLEAVDQEAMFLKLNRVKGEEKSPMGWIVVIFFFESLLTIL